MSNVVIEGMEVVIARDLEQHKMLLARTEGEVQAYRAGRAQEVRRQRHFESLLGGGKFNDGSLRRALVDIEVNIRHLSDKEDAARQKVTHHLLIVDTLTKQLADQNLALDDLAEYRRRHAADR